MVESDPRIVLRPLNPSAHEETYVGDVHEIKNKSRYIVKMYFYLNLGVNFTRSSHILSFHHFNHINQL
jgi:hypothetical protein